MDSNANVEDFHVAIIGAGIGGLALAMALHRKQVSFTVYEEAKQYSLVGAGIGFGPNGLQAMDMIEEDFRSRYEAICVGNKSVEAQNVFFEGLLMEDGLGLNEQWYGHSSWGHPDYTRRSAHRKQLLDVMSSFVPIENVKFNKCLTSVEQQANRVSVTFADGTKISTSILVGADGINSFVRRIVLGPTFPTQVEPVYADSYCYRGVIPMSEAVDILGNLTDVAKMYMGDKRCCVTYRISGGAEFNFLLCVSDSNPWPSKNAVTQKVTFEDMMNDFEGRDMDDRFIRLLSKADPIRWGLFHHRHTSTYYRDRVVLMGDSAHASLPFQAGGASQGLEDAVILSNLLAIVNAAAAKDAHIESYIQAAFDAYDTVRRPRAEQQLIRAENVSDMIYFQHAETGRDMGKILNRLQDGWFDWLWFHDLNADLHSACQRMHDMLHV